jgi:hypothetical protein
MRRKQLSEEETARMVEQVTALKEMLGSWDHVARAVDVAVGPRPEEKPTKEALRLASLGKGGSGVARAISYAAEQLLPRSPAPLGTRTVEHSLERERRPADEFEQRSRFDPLFWTSFAAVHPAFEEVAEATQARAKHEGWTEEQTWRVLNIAAKALPRFYGGGSYTHADARAVVARGVAIVIEDRDPDDEPAPKLPPEPPAPLLLADPVPTMEETLAKRDATVRPHQRKKLAPKR